MFNYSKTEESFDLDCIPFKSFIHLCNLKYLKFCKCMGLSLYQCKILEFASFKLKELEFCSNIWGYEFDHLIMKYLGASLQSLLLDERLTITIPIIVNLLVYCPNLITLEITNCLYIDSLIISYFKNLITRRLNVIFTKEHSNDEIYTKLASNLPIKVKEISIRTSQQFNTLQFSKILENCKVLNC